MSEQNSKAVFDLEKIYIKDVSFESPNSPAVFMQKEYQPDIDIDLEVFSRSVDADGGRYEVIVNIEIKAVVAGVTGFLVAVQQAGIFRILNFSQEQMPIMLEVAAPNTLLPFARQAIADLVTQGGFPQLLIQPVNFETILKAKIRRAQSEAAG
jgi:preprotein translocase subunit SecB